MVFGGHSEQREPDVVIRTFYGEKSMTINATVTDNPITVTITNPSSQIATVTNGGSVTASVSDTLITVAIINGAAISPTVTNGSTVNVSLSESSTFNVSIMQSPIFTYANLAIGENEIINGDFAINADNWVLESGWAWDDTGGNVGIKKTAGNTNTAYQAGDLENGIDYQVNFNVEITAGVLLILLDDGGGYVATKTESISIVLSWAKNNGYKIWFVPAGNDFEGKITYVQMYRAPFVQDAPWDNGIYGRQNGVWIKIG